MNAPARCSRLRTEGLRLSLTLFVALASAGSARAQVDARSQIREPARGGSKAGLPTEALAQAGLSTEALAKVGIFFRADAPAVLRNGNDPYLPVVLEVINGVEQTSGSFLSQVIKRDPLKLEGVNVYIKPAGREHPFAAEPIRLGKTGQFSFDFRNNLQPLVISTRMKKTLEVPLEAIEEYSKQHYGGATGHSAIDLRVTFQLAGYPEQDFYLRVIPQAPPLPELPSWYRGDIHYHSAFTDNAAERGAPLGVTKQAALDAGLNWVVLADHSTDLSPERYAEELREAAKYRDGRFLFIRGEEVTAMSNKDTTLSTLHLLALPSPSDPDKGFPDPSSHSSGPNAAILTGTGAPGSPPIPLKEALGRIQAAGGLAYAAHPYDPISPVVRGGSWDMDLDFLAPGGLELQHGLVGLEPWNRATRATADDARDPFCLHPAADPTTCYQPDPDANQYARLEKGIDLGWRPLLQKSLQSTDDSAQTPAFKVFLAAGSDAHGDFNYEATMDVVDFIRKPSRVLSGYAEDNAFGKISTVVFCPTGMGERGENVLAGLAAGRSVVSNGPLLVAGFDRNSNGSIDDPEDVTIGQALLSPLESLPLLQLEWASSDEFGPFTSLRILVGSRNGEAKPEEISITSSKGLTSGGLFPADLRPLLKRQAGAWHYIRLEGRTRNHAGEEFRCYTNPVWIRLTPQ